MNTATFRKSPLFRFIALTVLVAFVGLLPAQPSYAQVSIVMTPPGQMIHVTNHFEPPQMVGLKIDLKDPFSFNFIMDQGETPMPSDVQKEEFNKIIKYFLVSLAMPNKDMWVNLSPYESNRIIPEIFGQTEMGRDLLAQDYVLKQFTASLMYPENGLGKEFWTRVYSQAQARFGTTNINVNTFNKVWIVADKADIYQKDDTAFLVKSHLKVMLEQDFMAIEKNKEQFGNARALQDQSKDARTKMASDIVRQIIIPAIEKEVNDGKSFAAVRQAYSAEIMATWFKKTLRESLLGQVFADKSKIAGQKVSDPQAREKIYQQYLRAYKKGVFNYIREDATPDGQTIPRKYFSGGAFPVAIDLVKPVSANNPEVRAFGEQVNKAMMGGALRFALVGAFLAVVGVGSAQARPRVFQNPFHPTQATQNVEAGLKARENAEKQDLKGAGKGLEQTTVGLARTVGNIGRMGLDLIHPTKRGHGKVAQVAPTTGGPDPVQLQKDLATARQLAQDAEQARLDAVKAQAQAEAALKDLQGKTGTLSNEEKEQLRTGLQAANDKLTKAEAAAKTAQDKYNKLREDLEAFKSKTTEKLTGLQNDVTDRDSTIRDLRTKLANSTSPAERIGLQKQIDQLTTQQTKDNTTISDLQSQLQTLKDQIKQLNTDWANRLSASQQNFQEFRERNTKIFEAIGLGLAALLAAFATWKVKAKNSFARSVTEAARAYDRLTASVKEIQASKVITEANKAMVSQMVSQIWQRIKQGLGIGQANAKVIKDIRNRIKDLQGQIAEIRKGVSQGHPYGEPVIKGLNEAITAYENMIKALQALENSPVAGNVAPSVAASAAPAAETPAAEKTPAVETPAAEKTPPAETPAVVLPEGFSTENALSELGALEQEVANYPNALQALQDAVKEATDKLKTAETNKEPEAVLNDLFNAMRKAEADRDQLKTRSLGLPQLIQDKRNQIKDAYPAQRKQAEAKDTDVQAARTALTTAQQDQETVANGPETAQTNLAKIIAQLEAAYNNRNPQAVMGITGVVGEDNTPLGITLGNSDNQGKIVDYLDKERKKAEKTLSDARDIFNAAKEKSRQAQENLRRVEENSNRVAALDALTPRVNRVIVDANKEALGAISQSHQEEVQALQEKKKAMGQSLINEFEQIKEKQNNGSIGNEGEADSQRDYFTAKAILDAMGEAYNENTLRDKAYEVFQARDASVREGVGFNHLDHYNNAIRESAAQKRMDILQSEFDLIKAYGLGEADNPAIARLAELVNGRQQPAPAAQAKKEDLGGINLSDEHQVINIKVDGAGMPLPPRYQDQAMLNLNGLTSIIRRITPITPENVPALYELIK